MTVDERFEQLERQTQRLDKRNKRLTVALTMTATGEELGMFDTVTARHIFVRNDAGKIVVSLGANFAGNGLVYTRSAKGKDLVELTTSDGNGVVGA